MKGMLLDLARRQYGVVARCQLEDAGLSRFMIEHRLEHGQWTTVFPDIYRFRGTPDSLPSRAMAALLWAGGESALSHCTAGHLWGFESMPISCIHLISERRCHPPPGIKLHRVEVIDGDFVSHRGLRVTSVARTLVDLGAAVSTPVLQRAVDLSLTRRLVTYEELTGRLALQAGPGRRGAGKLRRLLADGPNGPQSKLERRFKKLLERAGLPGVLPQFEIDFGTFVGHVDFAIPELKIAIECDGYSYHGGKIAWSKDGYRRNRMALLGWVLLQVTWADVEEHPDLVIEQLQVLVAAQTSRFTG